MTQAKKNDNLRNQGRERENTLVDQPSGTLKANKRGSKKSNNIISGDLNEMKYIDAR